MEKYDQTKYLISGERLFNNTAMNWQPAYQFQ